MIESQTRALFARNPWNAAFRNQVAFMDMLGLQSHWTGDRREFLGRRMVTVTTAEEDPRLTLAGVDELAREPYRLTLAVDTQTISVERVVVALLDRFGIRDLMIENPPLEEVIKAIYRDGAKARETVPA